MSGSNNYLAASYLELEDFNNCQKVIDRALEIKDNSYSHLLQGLVHYEQGRFFRAIAAFNRSGKLFDIIKDLF